MPWGKLAQVSLLQNQELQPLFMIVFQSCKQTSYQLHVLKRCGPEIVGNVLHVTASRHKTESAAAPRDCKQLHELSSEWQTRGKWADGWIISLHVYLILKWTRNPHCKQKGDWQRVCTRNTCRSESSALCGVTGSGQSRGTYRRLVCVQTSQSEQLYIWLTGDPDEPGDAVQVPPLRLSQ